MKLSWSLSAGNANNLLIDFFLEVPDEYKEAEKKVWSLQQYYLKLGYKYIMIISMTTNF